MTKKLTASEIAREVLRELATRRKLPTPDNYTALYNEIAGVAPSEAFPDKAMKTVAASLPRNTTEQLRLARQFDAAVSQQSWPALEAAVQAFAKATEEPALEWPPLIRELLQQLERSHSGLTTAMKRETLERLLKGASSTELLHTRLQSLLRSWSQGASAGEGMDLVDVSLLQDEAGGPAPLTQTASPPSPASTAAATAKSPPASPPSLGRMELGKINHELQEWIADLLDNSIATLLVDVPELSHEAATLAQQVRALQNPHAVSEISARLRKFSYRLQFLAEDQVELRTALLHLLRLIITNISEVIIDDRMLHGQVATLLEIINQPLNLRQLDDMERRMKDVIFKQGMLKKQLVDAQERLRSMLASFVDRLADMTLATGSFHDMVDICAQKISTASDIGQISDVLAELLQETRQVQQNAQRSRDDMHAMRQRVEEAEREIARLQAELAQAGEHVRQDALTGVLNRKGMEEALKKEVSRFERHHAPLCIALLDIDNFKRLNDTLGHQAGDAALVHLAHVIRDTLRPQDTLARYGGEEFVILLPQTSLEESVQVITRLQRELTRKFFMHNNEKLLITFSAGIAEFATGETPELALHRADQAMYLAKRSGKNRVLAA